MKHTVVNMVFRFILLFSAFKLIIFNTFADNTLNKENTLELLSSIKCDYKKNNISFSETYAVMFDQNFDSNKLKKSDNLIMAHKFNQNRFQNIFQITCGETLFICVQAGSEIKSIINLSVDNPRHGYISCIKKDSPKKLLSWNFKNEKFFLEKTGSRGDYYMEQINLLKGLPYKKKVNPFEVTIAIDLENDLCFEEISNLTDLNFTDEFNKMKCQELYNKYPVIKNFFIQHLN